jgi:hypothetical protein
MKIIILNLKEAKMRLLIERCDLGDCVVSRISYNLFKCMGLELPDLDNQMNISCIPKGIYSAEKHFSVRNGDCISILNVKGRTSIQIHSANWLHQIKGCVAIGESLKNSSKGMMVTSSRNTMKILLDALPSKFEIEIK